MPKRIQRKRVKGWRMPPNTVYVGRPTKFGNPFPLGVFLSPQQAMDSYQEYVDKFPQIEAAAKLELRGKDLACFCREDAPCHADILLRLANE